MASQDPAGVGPVAVVVPLEGAVAVVVEQPLRAEVVDRGELSDRCIGPLKVVAPVPFAGGDLVMEVTQPGDLRLGQGAVGRDEPVAVAFLVATAERERALDVRADEILSENSLPVSEQLCEELVEVGVWRDDVGRSHRAEDRADIIDARINNPTQQPTESLAATLRSARDGIVPAARVASTRADGQRTGNRPTYQPNPRSRLGGVPLQSEGHQRP